MEELPNPLESVFISSDDIEWDCCDDNRSTHEELSRRKPKGVIMPLEATGDRAAHHCPVAGFLFLDFSENLPSVCPELRHLISHTAT